MSSILSQLQDNIHPIFDRLLQQADKEALLGHKGHVFWVTGLSGSGKSTVAQHAEKLLYQAGVLTQVLDGDNIRAGLNNNLTFKAEDRIENIRRIAEVAKLFAHCGVCTMASFISPTAEMRAMAKEIIGDAHFSEVYVSTSLAACEERDVKGLYKKARAGEIKNFTGLDAPYEAPTQPDLEIKTEGQSIEASAQMLFEFIMQKVKS